MAESKVTFAVTDVESEEDVKELRDALGEEDAVQGTTIETDGQVEILYDEDLISGERVKKIVREKGYEVEESEQ